jgi:hypothetical protein
MFNTISAIPLLRDGAAATDVSGSAPGEADDHRGWRLARFNR